MSQKTNIFPAPGWLVVRPRIDDDSVNGIVVAGTMGDQKTGECVAANIPQTFEFDVNPGDNVVYTGGTTKVSIQGEDFFFIPIQSVIAKVSRS